MLNKIRQLEEGQAVAELGLALLILLPITFWMLRLGSLLNLKHQTIQFARLAVWEKAYGRDENSIRQMIQKNIKAEALFSDAATITVKTDLTTGSSGGDYKAMLDLADGMKLQRNGYYFAHIRVNGELPFGGDYSLDGKYAMLTDPWSLTDINKNRRIDDGDLQGRINRIYLWFPVVGRATSGPIKEFLDTFESWQRKIRNFPFVSWLLGLKNLDIAPRGKAKLNIVPPPSDN